MDCPVCAGVKLVMSERQGIEIDYCPQCRGVWLDRGELDKIIDRSQGTPAPAPAPAPAAAPPQAAPYGGYPPAGQRHDPHQVFGRTGKHKKREGFLSDLFDFD
ncbi:MAG TPA: zf-TFIIB domain-containing protein [Noviherbaspirillum sp.]|uniref:TFIIB-type zinc ribbon-containing protein n=1 Tax=Noviherbaspirillum sp. TaxID=1926288 RepID=UPI002D595BB5|nr:zf-TFIIB domain-containing protein [Noviherbaspirillum sp.]HYD94899.1 zf-TFIIB domain-containing protein [Noviherbaspirillum sp.]